MYIDYEDAILARQDAQELWEDADDCRDMCDGCKLLPLCRKAAEGEGKFPECPNY